MEDGTIIKAADILKMIESVNPNDTITLDEIDARVWCWSNGIDYVSHRLEEFCVSYPTDVEWKDFLYVNDERDPILQVTRSRDALKAIRPEGWEPRGDAFDENQIGHFCSGWQYRLIKLANGRQIDCTGRGKTEELAELHAIIQAIEYVRAK